MPKIILDTNVFFSAFINPSGAPAQILKHWISKDFTLIYSEEIIEEYLETLTQDLFSVEDIENFYELVSVRAEKVLSTQKVTAVPDDPDDDKFISCALSGKADYIVSGDKHLLKMKQYAGTRIVTVKEFLDILDSLKKENL